MSLDLLQHPELRDGVSAPAVPYLTPAQNCRLELVRRRRLLWKGRHRQYFLFEGRTRFNFDRLRAQGQVVTPYLSVNLLRLISTTFADLLLGKDAKFTAEDPGQQAIVDTLAKRTDLHRVFYDAVVQSSWAGDAMVEVVKWGGAVYVQNLKPDEMFPVGDRNPDGQYTAYQRFATATLPDKSRLLLEVTYAAGSIDRACYRLGKGDAKGEAVGLNLWPTKRPDGTDLPDHEGTGIDVPTIVWLGNELDEGEPTSDYTEDLLTQQDHLNHAETQLAVVIAKHGSPKMYVSRKQVNPATGGVETQAGVFFIDTKDDIPGYVTWNAELAAALENRNQCMLTMATSSETTPSLLGIPKSAAAESAARFRLDSTKPLARVGRKAKYVGPFVRTVLDTARALEQTIPYVGVEQSGSAVEFADPMPADPQQQATVLSTLVGSKQIMPVEWAQEQLVADPEARAKVAQQLKDEQAAALPSLFTNPGLGGTEPGEQQQQQQQQQREGGVA